MTVRNAIYQRFVGAVGKLKEIPKTSTLLKDGRMAAEEFVCAGDALVSMCPSWRWSSAEPSKRMKGLPDDKQYLVCDSVISHMRTKDLISQIDQDEDVGDGWTKTGEENAEKIFDPDEDIEEETEEQNEEPNRDRYYKLSIVYDRYFRVPHMFLSGMDSEGNPLSREQMMEDTSEEHAEKTVTSEANHPFLEGSFLSLHPCRHHEMMKKYIDRLANPESFAAPGYLFMFLRMITTAVPTIDIVTPDIGLEK